MRLTPKARIRQKTLSSIVAYDAADSAPKPVGHTTPLEAKNAEAQGAPTLAIPCWTEATRVAEVTPPTNAVGVTEAAGVDRNNIPASAGGREIDAPGARHNGDGLTLDELEGLRRLDEVFGK